MHEFVVAAAAIAMIALPFLLTIAPGEAQEELELE